MTEIEIKCTGTDIVPFRQLKDFQGDLKTITDDNLEKLKNSIINNGFCAPVFVWKNKDKNYLIDGHQRLKALNSLFADGYTIPDIPIVYITADNKKDAKKKLLYISSQYGQFTIDGYADFALDLNIDFNDLRLTDGLFSFYGIEAVTDAPELKTGDKEPFQQMTFTLADSQAEIVKQAIIKAKEEGADSDINENSNGNALAMICEVFLGC